MKQTAERRADRHVERRRALVLLLKHTSARNREQPTLNNRVDSCAGTAQLRLLPVAAKQKPLTPLRAGSGIKPEVSQKDSDPLDYRLSVVDERVVDRIGSVESFDNPRAMADLLGVLKKTQDADASLFSGSPIACDPIGAKGVDSPSAKQLAQGLSVDMPRGARRNTERSAVTV